MATRTYRRRLVSGVVALLTGGVLAAVPAVTASAGTASAAGAGLHGSSVVKVPTFTPPMAVVGTVNLSSVASASRRAAHERAGTSSSPRAIDLRLAVDERGAPASSPTVPVTRVSTKNVAGEAGFVGLTGKDQALANGGLDLEPPDQGLCAGQGDVGEFINNAFSVYQPDGVQLLQPVGSPAIFLQSPTAFFSDPRCYYDAPTERWFLQEFIVGTTGPDGQETSPSLQFIAVSNTSDPTGSYSVWSIDTTDSSTSGCPCFGDYDEQGADANGYYITTDEFSISNPVYNGVIIYAISKETLEDFNETGIPPVPVAYRLTSDYFGQPYIVSPTSTPQGALFAPNTEYFVESNGNAFSDDHLAVYALRDTSLLAAPGVPKLYRTELTSEAYAFPPDASQKKGPIPLGNSAQDPEGKIQSDFDAVMETTYVNGQVYAELDTATSTGNDAAAWFVISPTITGNKLAATMAAQGYVSAAHASVIYPDIALDSAGEGYLLFALSGHRNFPSAAYIAFESSGPTGSVMIAAAGTAPEDGFTCYAAWVGPDYGGCRWGDYSMGVSSGGTIVMATEMIPPSSRDTLTNWGTYIWSAPPPAGT
jgi:hypothetical protein